MLKIFIDIVDLWKTKIKFWKELFPGQMTLHLLTHMERHHFLVKILSTNNNQINTSAKYKVLIILLNFHVKVKILKKYKFLKMNWQDYQTISNQWQKSSKNMSWIQQTKMKVRTVLLVNLLLILWIKIIKIKVWVKTSDFSTCFAMKN